MSLKAFHIVFIVACGLLCLGLGGWSLGEYRRTESAEFIWGMIVSFAAFIVLLVYGRWFLHKLRGVSYL